MRLVNVVDVAIRNSFRFRIDADALLLQAHQTLTIRREPDIILAVFVQAGEFDCRMSLRRGWNV